MLLPRYTQRLIDFKLFSKHLYYLAISRTLQNKNKRVDQQTFSKSKPAEMPETSDYNTVNIVSLVFVLIVVKDYGLSKTTNISQLFTERAETIVLLYRKYVKVE